jgi:hypothetical protein
MNRRELAQSLLLGIAGAMAVTGAALAGETISEAQALEALDPWADALFTGDPDAIARVLAPEYQILRSDGTGYSKTEYLSVLPTQAARSQFRDIVATGHGDVMVIRYVIVTDQTIGGLPVEAVSPRLSVFRRDGEAWLLVAHANFARLG